MPVSDDDTRIVLLDGWKKAVDVQQHFNDLEMRIRGLAVTVAGAFLGVTAFSVEKGLKVDIVGRSFDLAVVLLVGASLSVAAFWLLDHLHYHRLLRGAVASGVGFEKALSEYAPEFNLGGHISDYSPFRLWKTEYKVHSGTKIVAFYVILLAALVAPMLAIAFGGISAPTPTDVDTAASKTVEISPLSATPSGTP